MSVQQLVDCTWGYENNGCRGGWAWRAFQFVKEHGLATRASYGKYLAQVHFDLSFRIASIQFEIAENATGIKDKYKRRI